MPDQVRHDRQILSTFLDSDTAAFTGVTGCRQGIRCILFIEEFQDSAWLAAADASARRIK
jgi:hypothetical protein